MSVAKKAARRSRIRKSIRAKIAGTASRPRLSVFRSNKEIYAQIINDEDGKTIVAASSIEKSLEKDGNKIDVAKKVGQLVAEKALQSNVDTVVFDRNGYLYHGRVKALAEAAREAGLKF